MDNSSAERTLEIIFIDYSVFNRIIFLSLQSDYKQHHIKPQKDMKKHCLLKRILHCLTVVLMLAACGDNTAKKAEQLLQEARAHFEQGELDAARADIDSLRQTYPNIVEARRAALRLHQEIELKAAQNELARTDSLLQLVNMELDSLQRQVEAHKAALKATPEELTLLTRTRMKRDSIRTQFETLGAKIHYIRQKQKETDH